MRMPAIGKLFGRAKKTGKKAFALYLGDPQDSNATQMVFDGLLDEAEYRKLKEMMFEMMKKHSRGTLYQTVEP